MPFSWQKKERRKGETDIYTATTTNATNNNNSNSNDNNFKLCKTRAVYPIVIYGNLLEEAQSGRCEVIVMH